MSELLMEGVRRRGRPRVVHRKPRVERVTGRGNAKWRTEERMAWPEGYFGVQHLSLQSPLGELGKEEE